jgi:putative nucleotidyltransferase with HDIG domain
MELSGVFLFYPVECMPNYDDVIALVEELSSRRDPYNHHAPRVAGYAVKLAELLNLTKPEIELVRVGAHLHDIGKLTVRDEVINSARKLTHDEMMRVRLHTTEGYKMAVTLNYPQIVQDIILHHHENLDGTGYPDRLKGSEISMYVRIVSIADRYDAMISHRPYRKALSFENTKLQMTAERGLTFDPQFLDLFFNKVFGADGFKTT